MKKRDWNEIKSRLRYVDVNDIKDNEELTCFENDDDYNSRFCWVKHGREDDFEYSKYDHQFNKTNNHRRRK